MSESHFLVRKVAVLGAGVMGAQIAAHLANASVPILLFDLAAKDGDPNGIALKAVENLKKLEPSPLATKDRADYIDAANYDQHLELLAGCDLVIEAISERMDWKKALYEKVALHVGAHVLGLASLAREKDGGHESSIAQDGVGSSGASGRVTRGRPGAYALEHKNPPLGGL